MDSPTLPDNDLRDNDLPDSVLSGNDLPAMRRQ
jgi:hypothetical protein